MLGKEQLLHEEHQRIIEETTTTKAKKAAQSAPRPSTPHGNRQKNFIERNRQSVQSVLVSSPPKVTKKLKEDSQSISPTPSLKQQKPSTTQTRPVTPGANVQSSSRPKPEKKKIDGVNSTKSRRPTSPPASAAHSAHSRSHAHVRVNSPENGHGHSAHSRSHVRAASPEITLREDVKKLKRLLMERDDWLREKEMQILEAEDIIEAFQERVREVEARNRELQKQNEFMRNYIEEEIEKKKSSSNEPTKIISSVMNNIQRIRGDSASPVSKSNSPTLTSTSVSSKSSSPMSSPKPSPVLTTSKSKELLKANNNITTKVKSDPIISPSLRPHVVPQSARGNLIPANKKNLTSGNDSHPPRPTAPSPAAKNRNEPSSFNNNGGFKKIEMLDRHAEMNRDRQALAFDRKKAAAEDVIMEESEDSEVDEFIFDRDADTSDDHADSEFDVTTESENDEGRINTDDDQSHDDDDDDDDDNEESFNKWSTHASSKHDLDSIVEEDDDENDEFEYEPPQQITRQKHNPWTKSNQVTPIKDSFSTTSQNIGNSKNDQNGQIVNNGQSVYSSSSQQLSMINGNNNSTQKQKSQQRKGFNTQIYPHRDSMSSTKSDSSSDDSILSYRNDSYPSSITSPSSTDSTFGSFTKSNNCLYDQTPDSSNQSNKNSSSYNGISKLDKNGLNDIDSTSGISADYNQQYNNSSPNSNNDISNSAKNPNKCNMVLKSSSGNGSNDSIPVTRLPSPTYNTTTRLSGSSVNNVINSKRSASNLVSKQFNPRSTSPSFASIRASSPASSSRASTPSSNASTARAPSPASSSSSRASTPASESSRNASGYNRRSRLNSSSDKYSTAIPPPPPPPVNKDPFATLQHYLRLISENSVMESPCKSYDIKKVIDEGSSAKVYTAHPLSNPSEECAIKVVPLSYSLEFIFNEIYVLKNLKHKNIVEFKESFLRWDGKTREVWIAMEKCARGDVTSRAGKISQREVGRIAGDLLNGLKHLHNNGIIHRDIKLSNILADANNDIKL
ncbi:hypothetical protein C1645_875768, partial [Glomus cerebriforme]